MRYFISRYAGLSIPLFLCSLLPGQPAQCTQDTVVGTYATAAQGVMLVPSSTGGQAAAVPAASLAILSIDSQGRMSGKGYGAMGGGVGQVPGGGSF